MPASSGRRPSLRAESLLVAGAEAERSLITVVDDVGHASVVLVGPAHGGHGQLRACRCSATR